MENSFNNRADLVHEQINLNECFECDKPLIFSMKDKDHEFSLGLFTALRCLKIAEKEGFVPELQKEWWTKIICRYHTSLS